MDKVGRQPYPRIVLVRVRISRERVVAIVPELGIEHGTEAVLAIERDMRGHLRVYAVGEEAEAFVPRPDQGVLVRDPAWWSNRPPPPVPADVHEFAIVRPITATSLHAEGTAALIHHVVELALREAPRFSSWGRHSYVITTEDFPALNDRDHDSLVDALRARFGRRIQLDGSPLVTRTPFEPKPLREIDRKLVDDLAVALIAVGWSTWRLVRGERLLGRVGVFLAVAIALFAIRDFRRRPRDDSTC